MVSEIFWQNANNQYNSVANDYNTVAGNIMPAQNSNCHKVPTQGENKPVFAALKTIAPTRRIMTINDEVEHGNLLPALGYASLMLINLPEDIRDIEEAKKQFECWRKGIKYTNKYGVKNYKDYQHTFSSLRGTWKLEEKVKEGLAKNKTWAKILKNLDITFADTKIGEKILEKMKITDESIETKIKEITPEGSGEVFAKAYKYKSGCKYSNFGELTAKAMTRTTKLGVLILAAIEAPKVIKAMTQGDSAGDKAKNTLKQATSSSINIATVTAAMAYGGAYGWQKGGPFGSLAGMGVGAVLGSMASKKMQQIIE